MPEAMNSLTTTPFFIPLPVLMFIVALFVTHRVFASSRYKANVNAKQLPPGPVPWPILGNIPEMLYNKSTWRWMHRLMKDMNTDIACIRLGATHFIPVTCPEIAKEILKQQDSVFASRPHTFSQEIISCGYLGTVLSPHGDQWKKMTKIIASEILSPARHRSFHDKRAEEADNLVYYVHNIYKHSKPVNLRTVTRAYCGSVILRLMFNKRFFGEPTLDGGPGNAEIEHMDALFACLGSTFSFSLCDLLPFTSGLDLDGHKKVVVETNTIIDNYHDPIVHERVRQWSLGEKKEVEDFLDIFITLKDANGKPLLTLNEIKAQIKELVIAAPDNPSNAVEWTIAEMLNQPQLFENAWEELDRVVGKDRLVQESDINQLNYIKACLREAYRLHPVASFNVPHLAMKDTTVAGYFIPKGSQVLLSRLGLGRNPNVWSNPLSFNPERHMNNDNANVTLTEHDLRFISFSSGRRACKGTVLGTCMSTMLLARLLQCFRWRLPTNRDSVSLIESTDDLFLSEPLVALAEPRLPARFYAALY